MSAIEGDTDSKTSQSAADPGAAGSTNQSPIEIHVFVDTNRIKSGSATRLVPEKVAEIIQNNSSHPDVAVNWYMPGVVRDERRYQMEKLGKEMLRGALKFGKFLGNPVGFDEQTVCRRVDEALEADLKKLGITPVELRVAHVDFAVIIADAVNRRPPFEVDAADDGKSREKGFRDRIIGETVLQFLTDLRKKSDASVILVTGDGALTDFVKGATTSDKNFEVLESVEELEGRINAMVNKVPTNYIARLEPSAAKMFFQADVRDTLFYKVRSELISRYASVFAALPEGAHERVDRGWSAEPPRFVEKKGDRLSWVSRIVVTTEAYAREAYMKIGEAVTYTTTVATDLAALSGSSAVQSTAISAGPDQTITAQMSAPSGSVGALSTQSYHASVIDENSRIFFNRRLVAIGKTVFEIEWSVTVSPDQQLIEPAVTATDVKGPEWERIGAGSSLSDDV